MNDKQPAIQACVVVLYTLRVSGSYLRERTTYMIKYLCKTYVNVITWNTWLNENQKTRNLNCHLEISKWWYHVFHSFSCHCDTKPLCICIYPIILQTRWLWFCWTFDVIPSFNGHFCLTRFKNIQIHFWFTRSLTLCSYTFADVIWCQRIKHATQVDVMAHLYPNILSHMIWICWGILQLTITTLTIETNTDEILPQAATMHTSGSCFLTSKGFEKVEGFCSYRHGY